MDGGIFISRARSPVGMKILSTNEPIIMTSTFSFLHVRIMSQQVFSPLMLKFRRVRIGGRMKFLFLLLLLLLLLSSMTLTKQSFIKFSIFSTSMNRAAHVVPISSKFSLLLSNREKNCAERRRCEGVSSGSYSRLYTSCD